MAGILQTTFVNAFRRMEMCKFQIGKVFEYVVKGLIDIKSSLVQVMAVCCQAPSHYLSQC